MPNINDIIDKIKKPVKTIHIGNDDNKKQRLTQARPWRSSIPSNNIDITKQSSSLILEDLESVSRTLAEGHDSVSRALAEEDDSVSRALAENYETTKNHQKGLKSVSRALAEEDDSVSRALAEEDDSVSRALAKNNKNLSESVSSNSYKALAKNDKKQEEFNNLVGKELLLLQYVFKQVDSASLITTETTENLLKLLQVKSNRLRNLICRLKEKQLLEVPSYKNGIRGWRQFRLNRKTFDEIRLANNKALAKKTEPFSRALAENKEKSSDSVSRTLLSSSSYYNKTTTEETENLQTELTEIDIVPLADEIGFNKDHLAQIIKRSKLSREIIQNSIYGFAYDLKVNNIRKKIKGPPLNYIMSILCRGNAYAVPENYEAPRDYALRIYTENIKAINEKRANLEKEAKNLAFQEWLSKLSDDQKAKLFPTFLRYGGDSNFFIGAARDYFNKQIWPKQLGNIQGKANS